ncbi:MAG TPA: hypothetical protein VJ997_03670, partial [Longimicrobiales bacterium]|nr:hypothetical protein [Longimicrobiales bacterium]
MSMYDEFERAIDGSSRRKKGMGALGWLVTSLALFVVVGVVGVGFAMNRVGHRIEEMVSGFDYDAGAAAAKVVARLESHAGLLSADADQGLSFLETLDGDDPARAFLDEIFDGSLDRPAEGLAPLANLSELSELSELSKLADLRDLRELREGSSGSVHTRDGDVSIDLKRGEG